MYCAHHSMATEGADTSSLDPSNVLPDYTALNEGADLIDKLCGRIHAAVQSATDGFIAAFAGLLSMTNTFKANARSLQRRRSLWLDKQREEFDSVEKFLLACARLACTGLSTDLLDGLDTALTLLGCDTLPRYSGMTSICDNALGLVSASLCTRVQTGVSPSGCSSSGPGLLWCEPGWSSETAASHNVVTVTCGDEFGEGVRGLTPEDFLVEIVPESINSVVTGDISGPSEYTFMYKCNLSSVAWENEIHLRVCILGQLVHTCTVPVSTSTLPTFLILASLWIPILSLCRWARAWVASSSEVSKPGTVASAGAWPYLQIAPCLPSPAGAHLNLPSSCTLYPLAQKCKSWATLLPAAPNPSGTQGRYASVRLEHCWLRMVLPL